jgi:hypothetical protein
VQTAAEPLGLLERYRAGPAGRHGRPHLRKVLRSLLPQPVQRWAAALGCTCCLAAVTSAMPCCFRLPRCLAAPCRCAQPGHLPSHLLHWCLGGHSCQGLPGCAAHMPPGCSMGCPLAFSAPPSTPSSTLPPAWWAGHGECLLGFCKCHEGWFGTDCAQRTADTPWSPGGPRAVCCCWFACGVAG